MAKNDEIKISFKVFNQDFNKAMSEMKQGTTQLNREFKLQQSQMKLSGSETDKLKARVDYLSKGYDQAKDRVKLTEEQLARAKKTFGENSEEVKKLEGQLVNAKIQEQYFANELTVTTKQLKDAQDPLKQMSKRMKEVGSSFKEAGEKMQDFGKKLSTRVTLPIVGVFAGMSKSVMDLEATQAKYNTVFKGMTDVSDQFIFDFQKLTPATKAEARSMASGMQDLLVPMGFARDQAAGMTGEFMHVTGALANFNSGTHTAQQVQAAMTSALTGQYDSLKSLGIQLDVTTVKEKAVEMGLASSTGEVTKQMQAQVLLAEVYNQSGDALEAYTVDNLDAKTKMALMKSEVIDLAAQYGETLLPMINNTVDSGRKLLTWFRELSPQMQNNIMIVMALAAAIGPLVFVFGKLTTGVGAVISVGGKMVGLFSKLTLGTNLLTAAKIKDKLATMQLHALYAGDFIKSIIQNTAALIKSTAQWIANTAASIAHKVALGLSAIAQGGMTAATLAWNAVAVVATTVTTALGAAVAFLTSPIGLAILAIGAIIAIGVLLYRNWDTVMVVANKLGTNIRTTFNNIRTSITDPINSAKDSVSSAINKIKGFFSGLKLSFPKINAPKMPKFSISGKFSIVPPSVPKLNIKWNSEGAIFKKPTVLNGMGVGDGYKGTGSAMEAVLPITKLIGIIRDALPINQVQPATVNNINFNGNYQFRDQNDIDYFMQKAAKIIKGEGN